MSGIRTTEGWVPNPATERIMSRVRLEDFVKEIDWDEATWRLSSPPMPDYVQSSIHGLEGGYGTPLAAESWDPVVKEIFAEYFDSEPAQRDRFTARARTAPATILDAACGTGESTLAWRRRFPDADITAFDVSPYMAAVAERKLADDRRVHVRSLDIEHLPFPDGSFDLVTASLLFHELPATVSPRVLAELFRVCAPGAEIAVMEPYEVGGRTLSPIPFPEPYLKDFLSTNWDDAFRDAGFIDLDVWTYGEGWVRTARKPSASSRAPSRPTSS